MTSTASNSAPSSPSSGLTQSALARELSVSRQAIHQLIKRGILTPDADGKLDPAAARQAILDNLTPDAKSSEGVQGQAPQPAAAPTKPAPPPPPAPIGDENADTDADTALASSYHVAKTLKEAAEARMAQLKLAQMEGSLVPLGDAKRTIFTAFRALRDSLQNVAPRIKDACAAETDAHRCEALIDAEINAALGAFKPAAALADQDDGEDEEEDGSG